MSSLCTHCGAPLVATARFCTACGSPNPTFVDPNATRASDRLRAQEPADHSADVATPVPDAAPVDPAVAGPVAPEPTPEAPTAPYPAQPYGQPHGAGAELPGAPLTPTPPAATGSGFEPPAGALPYGQPFPTSPAAPAPEYGQPVGATPTYAPSAPEAQQPWLHQGPSGPESYALAGAPGSMPAPQPRKSKQGLVALIGGLVLLLAAGGFGGWWFFLRDSDDSSASPAAGQDAQWASPRAITEAPKEAWSWDALGVDSITSVGDQIIVRGDDGVRAFGADDQPLWTNTDIASLKAIDDPSLPIRWGATAGDDAVLVDAADGSTIKKIDGWRYYWHTGEGRAMLVQAEDDEDGGSITAAKIVDADGNDYLELPVFDTVARGEDALYLAQHEGKLIKYSLSDKKELWSVDIGSWEPYQPPTDGETEDPFYGSMALITSTNSLMVMSEQGKLEVRNPADGSVVTSFDVTCRAVYTVAPSLVGCADPSENIDYSSDDYDPDVEPEQNVHFYDSTGEVGSITTNGFATYYSAFSTGSGDDRAWYLKNYDGGIYDAAFAEVTTLESDSEYGSPTFEPNDAGLYLLRNGKLEFTDVKGTSTWSVDVPVADESDESDNASEIAATDDLVAVLQGGKLTTWQR